MKQVEKESIEVNGRAFKAMAFEYESMEEMLGHATKEKIVSKLNGYMHAHGSFSDIRALISDTVQELTKVEYLRKDSGEKDKNGNPIMEIAESDAKYVKRALALTPKVSFDDVQKIVLDRSKNGYTIKNKDGTETKVLPISVDLRKVERESKPKELPKKYREEAAFFLVVQPGATKPQGSIAKFSTAFEKKLGEKIVLPNAEKLDAEENIVSLGWALSRWNKRILEEEQAARDAKQKKEFAA